jgi:inner membrane protease ATP23
MQDTMTHELIHAFDDCTANVNWKNPRHVACSEIRAAALSGDCKFTREFARGNLGFIKHFQTCVKRRAILSLEPHAGKDAARLVESVWEPCFRDTCPFDEIP